MRASTIPPDDAKGTRSEDLADSRHRGPTSVAKYFSEPPRRASAAAPRAAARRCSKPLTFTPWRTRAHRVAYPRVRRRSMSLPCPANRLASLTCGASLFSIFGSRRGTARGGRGGHRMSRANACHLSGRGANFHLPFTCRPSGLQQLNWTRIYFRPVGSSARQREERIKGRVTCRGRLFREARRRGPFRPFWGGNLPTARMGGAGVARRGATGCHHVFARSAPGCPLTSSGAVSRTHGNTGRGLGRRGRACRHRRHGGRRPDRETPWSGGP